MIENRQWQGFLALIPWTSVSIVIANMSLLLPATHPWMAGPRTALLVTILTAKPTAEPTADLVMTSELSFMICLRKHIVCMPSWMVVNHQQMRQSMQMSGKQQGYNGFMSLPCSRSFRLSHRHCYQQQHQHQQPKQLEAQQDLQSYQP
jgi:hypothetical protein